MNNDERKDFIRVLLIAGAMVVVQIAVLVFFLIT